MYNKGIKCLCVIMCAISDDSRMCEVSLKLKELAFSLHLNITDDNEEKIEENMHLQYGEDQISSVNERGIDSGTKLEGSKVEKNEVETFIAKLEATNEVLNGSQDS
uniref:Uncharacterized protein n=1 Tax=Chenopodium quinoa TaxID=63459 RepID=A0A803KU60_CHEQI